MTTARRALIECVVNPGRRFMALVRDKAGNPTGHILKTGGQVVKVTESQLEHFSDALTPKDQVDGVRLTEKERLLEVAAAAEAVEAAEGEVGSAAV
jgi:hypothetical protein